MDFTDTRKVFGWIAVCLSLVYKFPQMWKLFKTGDISGISVESQIIQASAYGFYIVHGTIIEDPPIVFLGCTSFAQSAVLVGQYFYYQRKYSKRNKTAVQNIDDDSNHDDGAIEASAAAHSQLQGMEAGLSTSKAIPMDGGVED